jgi:hypothetical protein
MGNSLARIDTVTARAITTITALGTLLTGLGALAAGRRNLETLGYMIHSDQPVTWPGLPQGHADS